MQQDQWHYKDERNGKRLGPIDKEEVGRLIAADRIDRSTLVWNPAMPDWEKASATDLGSLFAANPPPLPASEISRWAIYALALFPLIGVAIQAVASAVLGAHSGQNVQEVFDQRAWRLLFLVGNGVLGTLDERNLRKGGLRLRGAAFMAGFLAPVYVFASCRAYRRHAGPGAWSAYLPLVLWVAAFAAMIAVASILFDPDAPIIFRPDAWF